MYTRKKVISQQKEPTATVGWGAEKSTVKEERSVYNDDYTVSNISIQRLQYPHERKSLHKQQRESTVTVRGSINIFAVKE